MNTIDTFCHFRRAIGCALVLGMSAAYAASDQVPAGKLLPITPKEAAWAAQAKAEYPLKTCVVSGDKLDGADMGKPADLIYREKGQPDRLIRFCCQDCLKDFKADPAKFLKAIDAAQGGSGRASK